MCTLSFSNHCIPRMMNGSRDRQSILMLSTSQDTGLWEISDSLENCLNLKYVSENFCSAGILWILTDK